MAMYGNFTWYPINRFSFHALALSTWQEILNLIRKVEKKSGNCKRAQNRGKILDKVWLSLSVALKVMKLVPSSSNLILITATSVTHTSLICSSHVYTETWDKSDVEPVEQIAMCSIQKLLSKGRSIFGIFLLISIWSLGLDSTFWVFHADKFEITEYC
jgi:hypothetical protein